MYNVSFCGQVPYYANKKITNAKASELAEAINRGVKTAEQRLGVKTNHPRVSAKLLKEVNTGSFDPKTQLLTDQGKKGFDRILKSMSGGKVSIEDKLKDVNGLVKDKIMETTNPDDGMTPVRFIYMI